MEQIRDFFRSDFSTFNILAHRAKKYWNLIWKSPGFVPFEADLTHFGTKADILDAEEEDLRTWRILISVIVWKQQKDG